MEGVLWELELSYSPSADARSGESESGECDGDVEGLSMPFEVKESRWRGGGQLCRAPLEPLASIIGLSRSSWKYAEVLDSSEKDRA